MKINRLFEIVYCLLREKRMPAVQLAKRFGVSVRTIYRDIDTLSCSGIPIYMSKGKGGGVSLLPDFVLHKTALSEAERSDILTALHSMNALDAQSVQATLSKLSALFGDGESAVEIDFRDWNGVIAAHFQLCKQAISQRKILQFDYINSSSARSRRRVEPYKLWFKERTWYLKAYCTEKQSERLFRLSRMQHVSIEDTSFIPRAVQHDFPTENPTAPCIDVVLHIRPDMGYRVYDEFPAEQVSRNDDGSFRASMHVIEDAWLYGYLLSFGSSAQVLSPPHVRERLQEELEKTMQLYNMTDS